MKTEDFLNIPKKELKNKVVKVENIKVSLTKKFNNEWCYWIVETVYKFTTRMQVIEHIDSPMGVVREMAIVGENINTMN